MPVDHPAAVFRCDNRDCDAISIVGDCPAYEWVGLPNGWFSIQTSARAIFGHVVCSEGCLKAKATEIATQTPF